MQHKNDYQPALSTTWYGTHYDMKCVTLFSATLEVVCDF